MSEKIYACLLRLYPAGFRQRFQAEALQFFRERLSEKPGILPKLGLWIDLIADLLAGLPQAYRNTYVTAAPAQTWPQGSGIPAFRTLEQEPLRPGSILIGGISAAAALAVFVFVMSHASAYHPFGGSMGRLRAAAAGTQSNPDGQSVAEKLDRQFQNASQLQACSFEKFEQHPGNIGYVKLSWFPDPARCRDIAEAVMSRLNGTSAIIFDLRDTRGGYPEMVRLMAGWLFDRPVPWYNPRATSPAQLVTNPAPASHLARLPVFVLTSSHTFSGAEHFAYNLKTLKRATIVGETTSGASHAGTATPPNRVALSEPKPVWEGHGVQPDVPVPAAAALGAAEKLALTALHRN